MQDKRLITVIAFALVFGLLAALLAGRFLSNVEGRSSKVVVAKENIPLSAVITADQLTLQPLPREATPEGVFYTFDKLVGRVSIAKIGAREPLTEPKLAPEGSEAGLTAMIAEGFRAITVKVDEVVGVAGLLPPGAWVDVVAVVNPQGLSFEQGPTSKIVLQRIKVLATDQTIEGENKESKSVSVKAVTLQVRPEQAEKLALAAAEGKLQLVMRNSVDKDDVHTEGINKQNLIMSDSSIPATDAESQNNKSPRLMTSMTRTKASSRRPLTPTILSPLMYEKPPRSGNSEKDEKSKPARNAVEVFDGGKRRLIELP